MTILEGSAAGESTVADGMRIDWDVPVEMDDGLVLRADVFRPIEDGQYPVIMTLGPYAKGLPFQTGYAGSGSDPGDRAPGDPQRVHQQVPELGDLRPGEVGARRLRRACVSTRAAPGARRGTSTCTRPRENLDYYHCHRVGRDAAVVQRQGRAARHLLLRRQPVAGARSFSRRTWRRSAHSRATRTSTASATATAASSTRSCRSGSRCR